MTDTLADGVLDICDEAGVHMSRAVAERIVEAVLATTETTSAPVESPTRAMTRREAERLLDEIVNAAVALDRLPYVGSLGGVRVKDSTAESGPADRLARTCERLLAGRCRPVADQPTPAAPTHRRWGRHGRPPRRRRDQAQPTRDTRPDDEHQHQHQDQHQDPPTTRTSRQARTPTTAWTSRGGAPTRRSAPPRKASSVRRSRRGPFPGP